MELNENEERLWKAMVKFFAIQMKTKELEDKERELRTAKSDALYEIHQVMDLAPEIFENVKTTRGDK